MEETYFDKQARERREYDNWLRSLRPGQGAVFRWGTEYHLFTVDRLTRTQIIGKTNFDKEMRFRRSDGRKVGSDFGAQLVKMTPRIRDAMEERRLRLWLSEISYQNTKDKPTLAQLRAMKKAFDHGKYLASMSGDADSQQKP